MKLGQGINLAAVSGVKEKPGPREGGPESAYERLRKRIVECYIDGFSSAKDAIKLGNTIELIASDKIDKFKFRQGIGSPDTFLAITENYNGNTMLKLTFMELYGNESAQTVCGFIRKAVDDYNDVHSANLSLVKEVIRDKPKPQRIG